MTTYRLWPATNGGALAAYSGPFVGATQFAVSGGGKWLNGYYIWVPTGGDTSPSGGYNTALWSLTTGASSGSGSLVSGSVVTGVTGLTANAWNFIALPTPIQLAPGWDKASTANGSTYVAAIGWTAANGFADTNGYWASGGGGGNGITNGGVLIGYSSNTGASNVAPYGMAQGLFSSTTSNAASTMPNQVSGTDNFWVDVQVSDTAPGSYSGTYRVWPNKFDANDFTVGDQPSPGENYTVATEVSLSQSCTLNNVWYYSPTNLNGSTAATTLATRCDVWNVGTGLSVASITSPSWLLPGGGAASAGAGWVKAAFAGGITLPAGDYRVSVYNSAGTTDINWNAKDASTDYFGETATQSVGAAGITWGPISAVSWSSSSSGFVYNAGGAANTPPFSGSASSHTQPPFYQPNPNTGAVGFPQLYAPVGGSSNQTQNYWIDLEVTPLPPPVAGQSQQSPAMLRAMRTQVPQFAQAPSPPPPLPAPQQSPSLVAKGRAQTLPSPQVAPPTPPLPAPSQGTGLLALRLPQSPQSPSVAAPPPPLPAQQNATTLLNLRLPQGTPSPQVPQPVPPLPAPQQSAGLLRLGLPQQAAAAQVAAPPPPPGPQPQSTLFLQRGLPTPGNFAQSAPVVVITYSAGQAQQAINLLQMGLPQQQAPAQLPGPLPPLPASQQALTFMQRGMAQPGNFQPGVAIAPPVLSPGVVVQQSTTLLRLGLPTPGNFFQVPPPVVVTPPSAGQGAQSLALLRRGLAQPSQGGVLLTVIPQQGTVSIAASLAATCTIKATLAGTCTIAPSLAGKVTIGASLAATCTITATLAGTVTIAGEL